MNSCLYKQKGRAQALYSTRTNEARPQSKNQRWKKTKKKRNALRPRRMRSLQEKRSTLRHSEEVVGVVPLLVVGAVGRRADTVGSAPLRCSKMHNGACSTTEGGPFFWPQNLKNTAGHFLLMIPAGSTRAGAVLARHCAPKSCCYGRCYISQREVVCLRFARFLTHEIRHGNGCLTDQAMSSNGMTRKVRLGKKCLTDQTMSSDCAKRIEGSNFGQHDNLVGKSVI